MKSLLCNINNWNNKNETISHNCIVPKLSVFGKTQNFNELTCNWFTVFSLSEKKKISLAALQNILDVSPDKGNLQAISIVKAKNEPNENYRKNSKYWDIYVWANSVDSDQTALREQSDQDLHCLPFFLHLFEALLHRKIKLFYIKDNYGSWSGCPII